MNKNYQKYKIGFHFTNVHRVVQRSNVVALSGEGIMVRNVMKKWAGKNTYQQSQTGKTTSTASINKLLDDSS